MKGTKMKAKQQWYNELYDAYGREWTSNLLSDFRMHGIMTAIEMIGTNQQVLDIGCYNGFITEKIREKGNRVIGIDLTDKAIELCKKKGIKCIKADIEKKIPFPNASFDAVFMGEIIEHLLDTDFVLKEVHRILKKNGILVITTPNVASLIRRIKLLLGKNPDLETSLYPISKKSGHIRYFTRCSLKDLLHKNSFQVLEVKSDAVLFKFFKSYAIAGIFPTLGASLIVKAVKR